ncbi:MAG TPA: TerC family protein [Casimicrobiaceae bacterium]|nr:TerC family protein [Casimicrobiaceae bacterium]
MGELTSAHFWFAVVEIIIVNIFLSGDNAVVIALACRNLSPRQRRYGIFWGVLGAVVALIVLTLFAMTLLGYPWLRLVGAVLLLWIGVKLIAEDDGGEHKVKGSDRLLTAVWIVIVADVIMSLDNTVAVAAAANGNRLLIVLGLTVSIPVVILGSQVIMRLIQRFPILVFAGGGLLGYIAVQMGEDDPAVHPWVMAHFPDITGYMPIAGFVLVVTTGLLLVRKQKRVHARQRSP